MGKTNDNAEFEEKENLENGAEGESNLGDENEEEEDNKNDVEEEGQGAGADDEDDGNGADEDEDEGKEKFVMPDKFKGKSTEEIAKAYIGLEKLIEKKASKRARDIGGGERKTKPGETPEWVKEALKGVDFTNMKPDQFASFLLNTIEARAQEIAKNTYEAADSTKAQVQTDINRLTKTWPQLKDHKGFRDIVLTLIENSASKGTILPLKDACKQAGNMLGIKPGETKKPEEKNDEQKNEEKNKKLGVERPNGSGGGEKQTDEEKVISGLMNGVNKGGGIGSLF